MDPEVELAEVEIVGGIIAIVGCPLTFKDSKQSVVLREFGLHGEAETLSHLIDSHGH